MSAAQSILEDKTQMTRQRHLQHQPRSRADCMPTRTSALPRTALAYQPLTGQVEGTEAVQLLQKGMFYLTQSIKRKDHNYRTPETTLLSETTSNSKIPGTGTDYLYGERASTLEAPDCHRFTLSTTLQSDTVRCCGIVAPCKHFQPCAPENWPESNVSISVAA